MAEVYSPWRENFFFASLEQLGKEKAGFQLAPVVCAYYRQREKYVSYF